MATTSSKSSTKSSSKKLVRNPNTPSLKSQGAGYSTTNRKGETTFYKSSKDAPGYNDTFQGKGTTSQGKPLSTFDSKGKVITAEALKPAAQVPLAPATPIDGLFGITNATNAGLAALGGGTYDTKSNQIVPAPAPVEQPANNNRAILDAYLQANNSIEAPSAVSNLKEMQKTLRPKENLVNSLTGQLNTLNASRDAEMLKLEGQGRGQTGGFIGGEQARINREASIQAMPIQAQLAIAQDDLESARTYAGQYFQAKMQDETNIYNQRKENNRLVFDFLNNAEQRRLAANEKALDREYAEKQSSAKSAEALAMQAIEYGQSSLAQKIMGLDTKSPTYAQDVRNLMGQLRKPVAAPAAVKRDTQVVDGKLIDMQTGEVITDLSGGGSKSALGNALAQQDIYNVNNILNSKGLDSAVGPTGLARTEGGLWAATKRFIGGFLGGSAAGAAVAAPTVVGTIPAALISGLAVGTVRALQGTKDEFTGDRAAFIGSTEQMIAGLTTDKLAQAKGQGITFGALSDGERQMIAQAASKIGTWRQREGGKADGEVIGYKIDEKNFKKELDTINYFKQLDAYLQGSSAQEIGAVEKPDGTVWVMDSTGNLRQLISTQ